MQSNNNLPDIHLLINENKYKELEQIIKDLPQTTKNSFVNALDAKFKQSPLALACSLGKVEIVDLLLENGADASLGGLRTRKSVLDHAKNYPNIVQKILAPIKKYVDGINTSDAKLTYIEKGKIALLAFSLADYYAEQGASEQEQHYFKIASQLTTSITDHPPATSSIATQVAIQGPLNWRMFHYYFKREQYKIAIKFFDVAMTKFEKASVIEESNSLFEVEMYFSSFCQFCMVTKKEDIAKIKQSMQLSLVMYLNRATRMQVGPDSGLKRICEFLHGNVKNMDILESVTTIGDTIQFYLEKRTIEPSLAANNEVNIYTTLSEFCTKLCAYYIKAGDIANATVYLEMSNESINKIEKQNTDNNNDAKQHIDKVLAQRINILKKLNVSHINDLNLYGNFIQTINSADFKNKVNSVKDYKAFVDIMQKTLLPVLQRIPNVKHFPVKQIGGMIQACFSHRNGNIYIDNVQINASFPRKQLNELIKMSNVFSKILHITKDPKDFRILNANLSKIITRLIEEDIKTIDPDALEAGIFELISILMNCEFDYIKSLNDRDRNAIEESMTLTVLDEYMHMLFNKHKVTSRNVTSPFGRMIGLMAPFYKQCYDEVSTLCPQLKFDTMTYLALSLVHFFSDNLQDCIKYTNMAISQTVNSTDEDDTSCTIACMGMLSTLSAMKLFPKYDEACIKSLNELMESLKIGMPKFAKLQLLRSAKQELIAEVNIFWVKQAEQLAAEKMYHEALKYLLSATLHVLPFLDNSKTYVESNLLTVCTLVEPLIQQLSAKVGEVDLVIATILDIVDQLLTAKMTSQWNTVINTIISNLRIFKHLNSDAYFLNLLISKIENHHAVIDKDKNYMLAKLRISYLQALNQTSLDDKTVETAANILDDCQQFVSQNAKHLNEFKEAIVVANTQLAAWYANARKNKEALDFYSNVIELHLQSTAPDESPSFMHALIESNKLMLQMVEDFATQHQLIEAINLCDEIIENLSFLADETAMVAVQHKQIILFIQYIKQLILTNKFSSALQVHEQLLAKINTSNEAVFSSLMGEIIEVKQQCEAGIKEQAQSILEEINALMACKNFSKAIQLCDKWADKLKILCNDEMTSVLLNQFASLRSKAIAEEKMLNYTYSTTESISHHKHSTLFASEPKIKTKGIASPANASPSKQQNNNNASSPLDNQTSVRSSAPVNSHPDLQKIGKRVAAPFIKFGTANLFPVLMKNIADFNKLKKTNTTLYKELKNAVLDGGICKKHGESGIKYLGNGLWEAKVNSRSRLLGKTVDGQDGFNYIVFDTFSANGLHRSK